MKKIYYQIAFAIITCTVANAQNKHIPWSLEAGVNYVNVYSVGENAPQGEFFDEFFNVNDHWNLGTYIAITRNLSERVSFTAKGSFNEITKWGQFGDDDVSVFVDNLEYYGLDGMINFNLLKNTKIQPYISLGGGYTWIEEGQYNTYSLEESDDDFVGAGTVNGALGVKVTITDRFGVNLQGAYKHSFQEYLTKHWLHSVGLIYDLGKSSKIVEDEALIDTDKDGVIDSYDVCPTVFGLKEYAGCPDTDNDGIPDSLDKCPDIKGVSNNKGCPLPDKDSDGIADIEDKCPNIKGMINNNGCPDSDNDGVVDLEDKCPNTKGTILNNGCPEITTPTSETIKVLNDYARIILFNSGKSNFKNQTYSILETMSNIIAKYPDTDFLIEGYTDSIGNAESNRLLSVRRANAVKDYFISKGINSNRLFAFGYGEEFPIDSNDSSSGRANNRRVVVKIKK